MAVSLREKPFLGLGATAVAGAAVMVGTGRPISSLLPLLSISISLVVGVGVGVVAGAGVGVGVVAVTVASAGPGDPVVVIGSERPGTTTDAGPEGARGIKTAGSVEGKGVNGDSGVGEA